MQQKAGSIDSNCFTFPLNIVEQNARFFCILKVRKDDHFIPVDFDQCWLSGWCRESASLSVATVAFSPVGIQAAVFADRSFFRLNLTFFESVYSQFIVFVLAHPKQGQIPASEQHLCRVFRRFRFIDLLVASEFHGQSDWTKIVR